MAIATKPQFLLAILAEMANPNGLVERPDRVLIAARMGISVHAVSTLIVRCVNCEALKRAGWDFYITGQPYSSPPGVSSVGHRIDGRKRTLVAPPTSPDDLGDDEDESPLDLGPRVTASGLEAITKIMADRVGSRHKSKIAPGQVAVSLPRIRFLEGRA